MGANENRAQVGGAEQLGLTAGNRTRGDSCVDQKGIKWLKGLALNWD